MTTTQKLIWAFWIFIIFMIVWEFYDYNIGLDRQAKEHPKQMHFYAYPPGSGPPGAPKAAPKNPNADVVQTNFTVDLNTPPGSFTCNVTLKNLGLSKATNIQVKVRPFKGVNNFDEDGGSQKVITLTDDDPISRLGTYITFPDLAPGESSTQSAEFISRSDFKPGQNPKPEIIFQTAKPAEKVTPKILRKPDD